MGEQKQNIEEESQELDQVTESISEEETVYSSFIDDSPAKKREDTRSEIKLYNKQKALDAICRMLGYNATDKVDHALFHIN